MSAPLVVGLIGASGRMGQAVSRAAVEQRELTLRAIPRGVAIENLVDIDVLVDFSSPAGFDYACDLARATGKPLVSGTTGLDDEQLARIDALAQTIPVLHANNMSMGVALLETLVRTAAAALPHSFEPELVELHHRHKRDAPSGTAKSLLAAVHAGRGELLEPVCGREGLVGERNPASVGVFAVRGGDVVGEHTVYFLGDGERIELTHRATDRTIFGRGALAAARWIVDHAPGRYHMRDVLGL